jgi:hypothetical protein
LWNFRNSCWTSLVIQSPDGPTERVSGGGIELLRHCAESHNLLRWWHP